MKTSISFNGKNYSADLNFPLDISIPLRSGRENLTAWYLGPPEIKPVVMGDWIADVQKGSPVNFRNIFFNPHAHGTHTECVGHISKEFYSINKEMKKFFAVAKVISVTPEKKEEDSFVSKNQMETVLGNEIPEAIVIRTLPNSTEKNSKQYSNTNPTYLDAEAALFLRNKNVNHILVDLPSVDPEKDDGKLAAHKAFWNYPSAPRLQATITEFIFVNNTIPDGLYLLNLMIAPFENDASPSKPVLYKLQEN